MCQKEEFLMRNTLLCLFLLVSASSVNAAKISFDSNDYLGVINNNINVDVLFDFTDNPAFGGGFNVLFDTSILEFVSYTQATFSGAGAPQTPASPIGALASPGNYLNAGVGSFEFFNGINTAGTVGSFIFKVIGNTPLVGNCGAALCLTSVGNNQMFNLLGQNITNEVFSNGITAANVSFANTPPPPNTPIPTPSTFALFGLGLAGLGWSRRKKA
jgi:hypothetical protein